MYSYSVVITVYNKEKVLDRCVQSLLNQTYKGLQIILVDDGSRDSSLALCNGYAQSHSNVKVVHQRNQGVAAARNTGLRAAQGEYVSFIDADDYLEEDLFEKVCAFLTAHPHTDMVSWGCCEESEQGERLAVIPMAQICFSTKKDAFCDLNDRLLGYVWLWTFRREMLLSHQILFDSYLEPIDDYYFVLQAFSAADTVGSVGNAFYHYVRSNSLESLSKRIPKHVFQQHKKISEYKALLYTELNMDPEYIASEMKKAAYAAFKNGMKQLFRANESMKIQKMKDMLADPLLQRYFFGYAPDIELKSSETPRYEAVKRQDYDAIYRLFELYEAEKQAKSEG